MPSCSWCGAALPPPKGTGRPRAFCSGACRQAAWKERTAPEGWAGPAVDHVDEAALRTATLDALEAELVRAKAAPPVDQLGRAVQEARVLASTFASLSKRVPSPLAWRADGVAVAVREALSRFFEDGETRA